MGVLSCFNSFLFHTGLVTLRHWYEICLKFVLLHYTPFSPILVPQEPMSRGGCYISGPVTFRVWGADLQAGGSWNAPEGSEGQTYRHGGLGELQSGQGNRLTGMGVLESSRGGLEGRLTGMGILESSLPMQFFMMLQRFRE